MLGKEEIVSPALDELKEHYQRIILYWAKMPNAKDY